LRGFDSVLRERILVGMCGRITLHTPESGLALRSPSAGADGTPRPEASLQRRPPRRRSRSSATQTPAGKWCGPGGAESPTGQWTPRRSSRLSMPGSRRSHTRCLQRRLAVGGHPARPARHRLPAHPYRARHLRLGDIPGEQAAARRRRCNAFKSLFIFRSTQTI
jgi:hypothetical protein